MKHPITIPRMGESIAEVTIGQILKPSGSSVSADDEILELETDKVNQVLYAPATGVIQLNVAKGKVVKVGETIGELDTEAVAKTTPSKEKEATPSKEKEATPSKEKEVEETPKEKTRVTKEDYIASLSKDEKKEKPPQQEAVKQEIAAPPVVSSSKRERHVPMSRIRQVIAKKMVEAQQQAAMLTTFNEIDMSAVIAMRNKYKEEFSKKFNVKLGFMSFFVKASIIALKAVPEINASIAADHILYRDYYDIGIAVGTDKGVFVPVVRDCDHKSFAEIEQEIADYAVKGRNGKLSIDEVSGGGFTITNGGVYGSLLSTPILNPPQSGILGMHKIEDRPIAFEGQVVIKPMMYVALSYDHRIVDGKAAVTFLVKIKEALEDPSRMVLGV